MADRGATADAIALYRRATDADPTFAKAFLNLGLLLFDTGDTTGSAAALTKAVQLDPTLLARIPAEPAAPPPRRRTRRRGPKAPRRLSYVRSDADHGFAQMAYAVDRRRTAATVPGADT